MQALIRGILSIAALAAATAHAQWSAVELDGFAARGVDGDTVAGESAPPFNALLWQGALPPVNLHPAGAVRSIANDTHGGFQVGEVVWGTPHAALWSGTEQSYVDLHPLSAVRSSANAVYGNTQAGFAVVDDVQRASIWQGSAASWVDIHPAGATQSLVEGVFGSMQVGVARIDGVLQAGLWNGTAASWTSLHPAGALESIAYGVDAGSQAGFALFEEDQAVLWKGSAASFVSLHPTGASASLAYAVLGASQAGFAVIEGNERAAYWVSSAQDYTNLHSYVDSRFVESWAYDISKDIESGVTVVAGRATDGATSTAILWRREPDQIAPHTLLRRAGNIMQGSVASLAESDDDRLEVTPGIVFATFMPPVLLEFVGQATASTATHMVIFFETAASVPVIRVTLEAYDYEASQFITLYSEPSSPKDLTLRFDRDDARFISPTGEMRLRAGYRATAPVFSYPWRAKVDWVRWRVMP